MFSILLHHTGSSFGKVLKSGYLLPSNILRTTNFPSYAGVFKGKWTFPAHTVEAPDFILNKKEAPKAGT